VDAAGCVPIRFFRLQFQFDVNPPDDEDVFLELHLSDGLGNQPLIRCIDLTRLQRAPKGSGQSTGGGCDDVIQRSGVGFENLFGNLIVFRHGAVDSEDHRFRLGREIGSANRPFDTFDSNFRSINYV
jgi:hypothetical protein